MEHPVRSDAPPLSRRQSRARSREQVIVVIDGHAGDAFAAARKARALIERRRELGA